MDKPMAGPTPVTSCFWDGVREHKVRIQYSPSADRYIFYPRILAPGTLADDLEWREVSGAGTLYTVHVLRRRPADRTARGGRAASVPGDRGTRRGTAAEQRAGRRGSRRAARRHA